MEKKNLDTKNNINNDELHYESQIENDPNIAALLRIHKVKGYLTYEELNDALPTKDYDSSKLAAIMSYFTDLDVKMISSEEEESVILDSKGGIICDTEHVETEDKEESESILEESKNDDPVKLYLKEMGNVNLLSREDEIVIAKKIEESKKMFFGALCESQITANSIVSWREKLSEDVLLIKDLIATETPSLEEEFDTVDEELHEDEEDQLELRQHITIANDEELKQKLLDLFDKHLEIYEKLYAKQALLNFNTNKLEGNKEYQQLKDDIRNNFFEIGFNEKKIDNMKQ